MEAPAISGAERWADAISAAQLFTIDPHGLGGISLRAMPGPVRDIWLQTFRTLLSPDAPVRRLPLHAGDDRLLGGLDLTATLNSGRPIAQTGLMSEADGGVVMAAMAERLSPSTAAHLSAALDSGEVALERDGFGLRTPARIGVIALDEGLAEDERPPAPLVERLAFHLDLNPIALGDTVSEAADADTIEDARTRLSSVEADDHVLEMLCGTALALGIATLRAPLLALKAARASAALADRKQVSDDDVTLAARLVLAPRATMLPIQEAPPEDQPPPEEPPTDSPDESKEDSSTDQGPMEDRVLEAVLAAIPPGLLAQLRSEDRRRGAERDAGRAGAIETSLKRGRPIGTRPGDPRNGARLNVVDTLRAAAPWQPLRKRTEQQNSGRIAIRSDDFRITRFKRRSQTTTIFVVDASGSAALNRLAEAKGAIELLLAESYVRRDQVALIAFRGECAELLLPPTRSLVRAKRSLAALPGGGGTPLAAGLDAARLLGDAAARSGDTPVIVVLTDGRANIARDGQPGRKQAGEDAATAARALRTCGWSSLLVDVSPRPRVDAKELAKEMGAHYQPLPRADARALSQAVRTAQSAPLAASAA
ncbi:MAG: magnesium chelatase subunit D [Alphaproteobacteria bacterium]